MHAVPITEQELFRLAKNGSIGQHLRAFSPSGPTPVADYPMLRMSGDGVTTAQSDGVAHFIEFAKQPPQLALLTILGYRARGVALPVGNTIVPFAPVRDPMPPLEPAASVAVTKQVFR